MPEPKHPRNASREADIELRIGPDGRVFVFGLSEQILEILSGLCPHDEGLARRLEISRVARER